MPEIWAPVRPSIPSGFSTKLMIGRETTSLSRTTAKLSEASDACAASTTPGPPVEAALGDLLGDLLELSRPSSVKSKVTFGWLVVGSNFCSGSLMSAPESAG